MDRCRWRTAGACRETDPFTPDLTEPLRWIAEMRQLGVALVNVTMGNPYAQPHFSRPFEYPPPDGYESPEHPLIGVDRHFQATETIQRAYPDLPSSAPATATCRSSCRRPGRRTSATAG